MADIAIAVSTEAQLNAAIIQADADTTGGDTFDITFTGDITEDTLNGDPGPLTAISLHAGVALDLDGGSHTLDGGGQYQGLFVYGGTVTVKNLTLADAVAHGGDGGDGDTGGAGGGAGLGGGLFVGSDTVDGAQASVVHLIDVAFANDSAIGGEGMAAGTGGPGGGGGGLGGQGGDSGGGGGIGHGAIGAGGASKSNGVAGLVPGAAVGGAGVGTKPGLNPAGGASGGGGGGVGLGTYSSEGSGGSGGGGVNGASGHGETGGAGGYGGGGGGASGVGGAGGFGGGGGGAQITGGAGGFGGGGGGGGSALPVTSGYGHNGVGGFGGGAGRGITSANSAGGGGGLGAGGDIFVQQGAALVIEGGTIAPGVVTGGASQLATAGAAYGQGVFLQGSAHVDLEAAAAQTLTVTGLIADQTGSAPTAASQGSGGLVIGDTSGVYSGTVVLDPTASAGSGAASVNVYTGGTTIDSGTLELGVTGAAGPGAITFAGPAAALQLAAGVTVANTLYGLQVGDSLILSQPITGFSLASGNVLNITQQDGTTQTFHLDPSQTFPNEAFGYAGDTLTLYGPPATVAQSTGVVERQSVTGAALTGDSTANPQGVLSVTAEATPYQGGSSVAVPASGQASLQGAYGVLTIAANGTYSYAANSEGETVGVHYADTFTVTVADGLGTSSPETLTFTSLGSATGNAAANIIIGGSGAAETIEGLGAADLLIVGAAPDTFLYTSASDSPYSTTAVTYDAIDGFRSGTDRIDVSAADGGAVELVRYDAHGSPQTFVYFDPGGSGGYQGVIDVYGIVQPGDLVTSANPIYDYGDGAAGQVLDGSVGHSFLVSGGAATDTLLGGPSDILYGGSGADAFVIGALSASPVSAYDVVASFGGGVDKLDISAADGGQVLIQTFDGDTFVYFDPTASGAYQGVVEVTSALAASDLTLSAAAKAAGVQIIGDAHEAATAVETLAGGPELDYIYAGSGADTLYGAGGGDFLVGGAGSDTFAYRAVSDSTPAAQDIIYNFDPAKGDLIDLSVLDQSAGVSGHFVSAFDGHAGEYELVQPTPASSYWHLLGDLTGAGSADFEVAFNVVGAATDFSSIMGHIHF